MLEILNLALNNNYIYIGIIVVLLAIIIMTILSIKKDRSKMLKTKPTPVSQPLEPATSDEEQAHAKLELEKVVNDMKKDADKEPVKDAEIKDYEKEQEDKAIISYQELVDAVRKNNVEHQPQTEVGMEVAEKSVIEEPVPVETIKAEEETNQKVDNIIDLINKTETPVEPVESETVEPETNIPVNAPVEDVLDTTNVTEDTKETVPFEHKFQTSEFISPIYGKQTVEQKEEQPRHEAPHEDPSLDQVIDDDITNSEEFLNNLKDFKNNL